MSKEHFWPQWSEPHLPQSATAYVNETQISSPRAGEKNLKKERPGDVTTRKMRVVCNTCNSGWMSELENAAKPHFLPLITGANCTLSSEGAAAIARWCAMKIMVAEHDEANTAATPFAHREAMRLRGEIPDHFSIRIGTHDVATLHAAFRRHSATLVRVQPGIAPAPPPGGLPRNVQEVCFIFGRLVVHAFTVRDAGYNADDLIRIRDDALPRIWPSQGHALSWPPDRIIHRGDIHAISTCLEAVIAARVLAWLEQPTSKSDEEPQ